MTTEVETAVYRLRVEGQEQIDRATRSVEGLATAEDKLASANRTTSASMQRSIAQLDPLIAAQEKYLRALRSVENARERGVSESQLATRLALEKKAYDAATVAAEHYRRAQANAQLTPFKSAEASALVFAAGAKDDIPTATAHMNQLGNSTKVARYEMINLGRQANDVIVSLASGQGILTVGLQQGSQILDVFTSSERTAGEMFKQMTAGALSFAATLPGIIAGLGAAAVAVGVFALQWDKAQKSSEQALLGAGARTGTSVADVNQFVGRESGVGGTQLSQKEARTLAEDMTKTGDIVISQLHGMSDAVVGFATMSKKSMSEASKDIVKFASDPRKALDELAKTYGAFAPEVRTAVESLTRAGDKTTAWQVIMDAVAETNRKAAESMDLGTKAARTFGNALATEVAKPTDLQQRLEKLNETIAKTEEAMKGMFVSDEAAADMAKLRKDAEDLQKAIDKINATKATAQINKLAADATSATEALIPQIEQLKKLEDQLAALERAREKGVTSEHGAAADDQAEAKARAMKQELIESQEAAARVVEETNKIAEAHKGVSREIAKQLYDLELQTNLARAVTEAERQAAQAAIDYAAAKRAGAKDEEATLAALEKQKAAQEAINAASREKVHQTTRSTEAIQRETALINEQIKLGAQMTGDQAAKLGMKQQEAQDQAKINELIRQGVKEEQASAQVAAERANSNAKVAQEVAKRIQKADQEIEMAHAITHADEMRVQFQRTYNELRAQGVSHAEAELVATKEFLAEQEKVNKAIQQEINALNRSTEMIYARVNGEEGAVAAAQAYTRAMEAGASATQAAALAAATLANYVAQADAEAIQLYNNMLKAVLAEEEARVKRSQFEPITMPTESMSFAWVRPEYQKYGAYYKQGGTGTVIEAPFEVQKQWAEEDKAKAQAELEAKQAAVDKLVAEGTAATVEMYDLNVAKAKASGDKVAELAALQAQLGYVSGLPESSEKYNQMASLQDAIESLTTSTDDLNSTMEDLLSPYYTQDPRTSHIGFRSQGMAAGGYVDVPGSYSANDNMLATIPVASGERIYVDPMTNRRGTAGGGMVINISSPINIYGNADADQFGRTVYQNNQLLAKQVRAASQ